MPKPGAFSRSAPQSFPPAICWDFGFDFGLWKWNCSCGWVRVVGTLSCSSTSTVSELDFLQNLGGGQVQTKGFRPDNSLGSRGTQRPTIPPRSVGSATCWAAGASITGMLTSRTGTNKICREKTHLLVFNLGYFKNRCHSKGLENLWGKKFHIQGYCMRWVHKAARRAMWVQQACSRTHEVTNIMNIN